jgi:thioredoxin reductase
MFSNKPLAVIGGGDSAAEEATCEFPRFAIAANT